MKYQNLGYFLNLWCTEPRATVFDIASNKKNLPTHVNISAHYSSPHPIKTLPSPSCIFPGTVRKHHKGHGKQTSLILLQVAPLDLSWRAAEQWHVGIRHFSSYTSEANIFQYTLTSVRKKHNTLCLLLKCHKLKIKRNTVKIKRTMWERQTGVIFSQFL